MGLSASATARCTAIKRIGFVIACGVALASAGAAAAAQDSGVPFKVQPIGDQVINGVLIQGGYVPVWTDQRGHPGGRPSSFKTERDVSNQGELDELAGYGRDGMPSVPRRRQSAPMTEVASTVGTTGVSRSRPQFDTVQADQLQSQPTKGATITRKRLTRSDEEELAALQAQLASVQEQVSRKQHEVEERKKDAQKRAEEERLLAEREASMQKLVFQAKEGQLLSDAISSYVGQNGWDHVEWNLGPDFRIKYAYFERPKAEDTMKDVLRRVLEPYNLSAELNRGNSVVEIFQSTDKAQR